MAKKKVFQIPYINIDNEEINILYGLKGEASTIIKIINKVSQYSGDSEDYLEFHQTMSNIIKIVGEGFYIQKIDIFSTQIFSSSSSEEFLQKKYDEHFEGRNYKTITTYLVITKEAQKNFNQKKHDEYFVKIHKIFQLLESSNFSPKILKRNEIDLLIKRMLTMEFKKDYVSLDNFKPTDIDIKIGEKVIRNISMIDTEVVDLPEYITPYIEKSDNEALKGFPVDFMAFLLNIEGYESIIYNQVIHVPSQVKTLQKLETKKKRHTGIPDAANDICVEDIEKLEQDVAREGQLLVNCHFNIIVCSDEENIIKAANSIEAILFTQGVNPSKNSCNQLELFRTALPGNAVELKDYDWFLTTNDAALSFFFKEALPISDPSNFYLRFTNRQGIPINVDPADYPMHIGRISNRNKFVLGPSGSGKSFLMNAIVEQYMIYNMDVVIVDTGDSYSGTCSYYKGKYITYTEEKPITMNPFFMKKEEYNIEKKNFLQTLIALLWKGADGEVTQVEADVITEVITSYYTIFFNEQKIEFKEDSNIDDVEYYLVEKGIDVNFLLEKAKVELEKKANEYQNHYSVLHINSEATTQQIKKAYRSLSKKYHPDVLQLDNNDLFARIAEAYSVLINPETRAKYDNETLLIINREIESLEEYDVRNDKALMKLYFKKLLQEVRNIQKHIKIDVLDFNSFYEFSLWRIPLIMNKDNIEFEFDEFRFVLKKFYKGGEFDMILNEQADNSLFYERFIVFEIDNIKEHKVLFPIVTLIIMDVFIQKMRLRKTQRKVLIIEEAWKAIASPMMANYILYLYKTVRKFWGEAIVVTQELGDILGNAVVKDSILNNSDSILLLDQTKFKENFTEIANLLSLNPVEQKKIFTINNLDNKENRGKFKEFYFKRGSVGEVYGVEVSLFQYLTYTTEKPEKTAIEQYVSVYGTYPLALEAFVSDQKKSSFNIPQFVDFVNLNEAPLSVSTINNLKKIQKIQKSNTVKWIKKMMKEEGKAFNDFVNQLN